MSKARKLWVVFMTAVMLVIAAAAMVLCAGELSRAFGADQVLQPGAYADNWSSLGGASVTQGGTNTSKSLKENGYKADVIDGYTIVYFELGGTGSGTAESLADITYKKGLTVTPHFNVVDLDVKITTNASGRTIEMQLIGPAFINTYKGQPTGERTADPSGRKITVTEITNGGMREDGIGIVTTDQDGKATITTKTTADCEYRFEMRDFEDRPINLTAYRRISNGKIWQEFRITAFTNNQCDGIRSKGLVYEYYYLPKDVQYEVPYLPAGSIHVGATKQNNGSLPSGAREGAPVTIDLNGHVLDFSKHRAVVNDNSGSRSLYGFEVYVDFTILDSDASKPKHRFRDIGDGVWQLDDLGSNTIEGGAIVGLATQAGTGRGGTLAYCLNGDVTIEGGTFAGNVVGSSTSGSRNSVGALILMETDNTLYFKGGEFRNNTIYSHNSDTAQTSGGIFLLMSKASFEMTGGKIYNNTQYYFNQSGAEQSGGAIILFDPEGNWHPGPQVTISGGYVEKMIPAGETSLANGAAISISAHPTIGKTDGKNDILTIEGGYINGAIVNRPWDGIDILDAENSSVTGGYFTQEGIESIQKLGILGAPKTHGGYVAIDLTTDPAGKHYGDTAYNAYGEDLHFRVCEATTASYTGAQKGAPAYDGKPVEEGTDFTISGFASGITAAKLNATYSYLGQTPAGEGLQGDGLPTDAGTYTVVAHIPAWIDVTRADGLAYLAEDVSFQLVITELGSLDDLTLTASNSIAYRNYVIEPTLAFKKTADGSAVTLKKDVDYTILSGGEGIDVGTYTVYVKGIGGYTGTANAQWTIVARSLTNRYYMYLTEEAAAKKDKNLRMYKVGDYKALEGVTSFTFDGEEHTPTFYGLFGDKQYAEMLAPSDGVHVNTYHPNTSTGIGTYKKDPAEAAKRPMDYQINVDAKTDAGSYTWSITPAAGINNLTGTMSLKWQITARDISEAQIAFTGLSANYTAFEQSVTVKSITFGNYTLTEDDYELQGEWKATDAGKHAFKVVGKGNFKGEVEYEFEIVPRKMSELTVLYNDVFYDGTEKLPDINQVKWVYTPLRVMNPADYTITADKQIDAGTYKLTLAPSGNGNISGNAREFNWQIKIRDLTGAAVELSTPGGFSYDGKEHSQTVVSVTAKDGTKITGGWSVTSGDKGTAAGDYTLVITGDGKNCTKTASVTWAIGKESITGFTLTANNTIPYYNATITPTITLKKTASDKNALTLNTDYKIVSGGSGVNAGDYTLIVEGMGNYTGRLQVDWKIDPRDLSKYVVTLKTSEVVYTGKELTGEVDSIYCNATHKTPIGKDDYTLDWGTGRINVNTYTVTILPSGNGNVTGKPTAKWKITPRDINDAKIATQLRFGPGEYGTGYETWYGGHDQEILVKSATYNGMTLQEGTDFTVTGNKATNAGDYIIAVKGKGNYNGEWTHDWKITARDMSDVTVTLNELTFNNAE